MNSPNFSVLIVEDEAILRLDIKMMLRELGFTVAGEAASGEEAVDLARDRKPGIVLMDIQIEGTLDGVETARRILEYLPAKIVFMSAFDAKSQDLTSRLPEAAAFLAKPFERKALEKVLLELNDSKPTAPKSGP